MKYIRHGLLLAATTILAACATTTPYQPASKAGAYDGYSSTKLENDRVRVSFGGNSLTDRETVENYLLYRAAELTRENGYDSFTLVERDVDEKTRLQVSPGAGFYDPYFRYSFYRPNYGWGGFYPYSWYDMQVNRGRRGWGFMGYSNPYAGMDVREITKYRAVAEIKFGRGNSVENDNTFNAREVLENLGPTLVLPEEKG